MFAIQKYIGRPGSSHPSHLPARSHPAVPILQTLTLVRYTERALVIYPLLSDCGLAMAQEKSFEQPQHPQNQSQLLSLATEIRLKILRYLLKFEGGEIKDFITLDMTENEYYKHLDRSAQILATCQQLLWEGRDVLHGENELVISVKSSASSMVHLHLRDTDLALPGYDDDLLNDVPDNYADIPEFDAGFSSFHGPVQWRLKCCTPAGLKIHEHLDEEYMMWLKQFKKVKVDMCFNSQQVHTLFVVCRALKDFVRDKAVVFRFATKLDAEGQVVEPADKDLCSVFEILRCKSFKLENYPMTERLIKIIESDSKPLDLYQEWYIFMEGPITNIPAPLGALAGFEGKHETEVGKFLDAVMRNRATEYREQKNAITRLALEWNRTTQDWWLESTENMRRDVVRRFERCEASLQQGLESPPS